MPPFCRPTKRSPFGATTACRASPRPLAATSAQNPVGRVMPPLSLSQAGEVAADAVKVPMQRTNEAVKNPEATRLTREIIQNLLIEDASMLSIIIISKRTGGKHRVSKGME